MKNVSTLRRARQAPGLTALALILLCSSASGCMMDFDGFTSGETGILVDTDLPDATDAGDDVDTDAETPDGGDADLPPDEGEPGSVCAEDSDCTGEGVCRSNVCLTPCTFAEDTCSAGFFCSEVGAEDLCVPACDDRGTCDARNVGRDDLSCVYLKQSGLAAGTNDVRLDRACLVDSDDDGVTDAIDNCPDVINPTQRDSNGDGLGDACSDEPSCHPDAADGLIIYPRVTLPEGQLSAPLAIYDRDLVLLSNSDDPARASTAAVLDRAASTWTEISDLPYPGVARSVTQVEGRYTLISPGHSPLSERKTGRWLTVMPGGSLGAELDFGANLSSLNSIMMPSGVVKGLGRPPQEESLAILNILGGGRVNVRGWTTALNANAPLQLVPTPYDDAELAQYDSALREIVAITFSATGGISSTTRISIPTTWPAVPVIGEEDLAEDLSGFDPIIFPAAAGQRYLFDRNTGRAGRINGPGFQRLADYDIPELFEGLTQTHVYVLPQALGLGVVGRPADAPDQVEVRELYFNCHPVSAALDGDEDGTGDIIDTCPITANADQLDLDGNGLGDACDDDIDGDNISNGSDILTIPGENGADPQTIDMSMDADNDGTPDNDDTDVDSDGILDRYDPFPRDSSNNGLRNTWSIDSDGDGAADSLERSQGSNPFHPLDTPTSRNIIFLTEDDSGSRTLYRASKNDVENAVVVELPATINPHGLRMSPSGRFVSFLTAAPGQTESFGVYDLTNDAFLFERNVGAALRSINIVEEGPDGPDTYVATQQRFGDTSRWRISQIRINPDVDVTTIFSGIDHIWESSQSGNSVIFTAYDTDCRDCALTYGLDLNGAPPQPMLLGTIPAGAQGLHHPASGPRFITSWTDDSGAAVVGEFSFSGSSFGNAFGPLTLLDRFESVNFTSINRSVPRQVVFAASSDADTPMIWVHSPNATLSKLRYLPAGAADNPIVELQLAP
ncbi:EB domain-containing protein [Lujinxingia sediminis]|uniref:EB domain-containing protein n=1 Tax=Lujinxingia sediminis TaxID=2480984 RepID=UPI0019D3058B|nr:thrombospondin type 3 repeat-containing protein [Lujinxingia sediminis]